MTDAGTIRLIFSRAIRTSSDAAAVHLRPEQLVLAFGHETAERLAGQPIDVSAIDAAAAAARKKQLDELRSERDQLKQLVRAGQKDSRRQLAELQKLIAKCEKGQLQAQALVTVNVGQLRAAIATAGLPAIEPEPEALNTASDTPAEAPPAEEESA